jgi:hypothetical protein
VQPFCGIALLFACRNERRFGETNPISARVGASDQLSVSSRNASYDTPRSARCELIEGSRSDLPDEQHRPEPLLIRRINGDAHRVLGFVRMSDRISSDEAYRTR